MDVEVTLNALELEALLGLGEPEIKLYLLLRQRIQQGDTDLRIVELARTLDVALTTVYRYLKHLRAKGLVINHRVVRVHSRFEFPLARMN